MPFHCSSIDKSTLYFLFYLFDIQVYVDNVLEASKDKPKNRRNPVANPKYCAFTFGGVFKLKFELEFVHIVYAEKDVSDKLGIITGNSYFSLSTKYCIWIQFILISYIDKIYLVFFKFTVSKLSL